MLPVTIVTIGDRCLRAVGSLALAMILGLVVPYYIQADEAQYLYDDQGRLTGVADSAGATAVYNYDSVGNLLSVDRFTPPGSGIGVYLVNPANGPVTELCRVHGYGFDLRVRS